MDHMPHIGENICRQKTINIINIITEEKINKMFVYTKQKT